MAVRGALAVIWRSNMHMHMTTSTAVPETQTYFDEVAVQSIQQQQQLEQAQGLSFTDYVAQYR